jgi:hypothetical protein
VRLPNHVLISDVIELAGRGNNLRDLLHWLSPAGLRAKGTQHDGAGKTELTQLRLP